MQVATTKFLADKLKSVKTNSDLTLVGRFVVGFVINYCSCEIERLNCVLCHAVFCVMRIVPNAELGMNT